MVRGIDERYPDVHVDRSSNVSPGSNATMGAVIDSSGNFTANQNASVNGVLYVNGGVGTTIQNVGKYFSRKTANVKCSGHQHQHRRDAGLRSDQLAHVEEGLGRHRRGGGVDVQDALDNLPVMRNSLAGQRYQ